jgi:hypothetical protein
MPGETRPTFEGDPDRAQEMAEAEKPIMDQLVEDKEQARRLREFAPHSGNPDAVLDDADFLENYNAMGKLDAADEAAEEAGKKYDAEKAKE